MQFKKKNSKMAVIACYSTWYGLYNSQSFLLTHSDYVPNSMPVSTKAQPHHISAILHVYGKKLSNQTTYK